MNINLETNFPPALERSMAIFDLLCETADGKTIKELSQELSIPIASTYRIVRCLLTYGYLQENKNNPNKYLLGYKLSILAEYVSEGANLKEISNPYMKNLTSETSQASQLHILLNDSVTIIHQILPVSAITVIAAIGEKIPCNSSASSKLLTALLPPDIRENFIKKAWTHASKNTVHTIDNINMFKSEIQKILTLGYAIDYEEYALGIGCMSVAIYDGANNPIAALGINGSIDNYRDENIFNANLKKLQNACRDISTEISRQQEL